VICLCSLRYPPSDGALPEEQVRRQRPCDGYLETPCNHRFHEDCLAKWMNMKLECPSCRAVLPPRRRHEDDSLESDDEDEGDQRGNRNEPAAADRRASVVQI
jgi:hypothetical protein